MPVALHLLSNPIWEFPSWDFPGVMGLGEDETGELGGNETVSHFTPLA